jgi:RNA polymerase sigma factor (sigma-70 family)
MCGEMKRSPVLATPGSNNYSGLIASSTSQSIGAKATKLQALSKPDANDLCVRYRPLAFKIAGQYCNRGVELDELRSAGLLGLVHASKRFHPERGIAFGCYAKHWIKGQILELFKPKADAMGLSRAHSLSAPAFTKEDDDGNTKLDLVTDDSEPIVTVDPGALSERERGIFGDRLEGKTLDEIGNNLAISRERVRQLSDRAVEKVGRTRGNIARACIRDLVNRRGYNKPSRPLLPLRSVTYPCRSYSKAEIEAYERGEL